VVLIFNVDEWLWRRALLLLSFRRHQGWYFCGSTSLVKFVGVGVFWLLRRNALYETGSYV
jgi:hypothetical protein